MIRLEHAPLPHTEHRSAVIELYAEAFGPPVESKIAHLEGGRSSACWLAFDGPLLVGLKWGTERRTGEFHSNLGIVRASHRRRGIARALMHAQHGWAREAGYPKVTTNTFAHNTAMLLLDLSVGFDLVGVRRAGSRAGAPGPLRSDLKLQLERDLLVTAAPLTPDTAVLEAARTAKTLDVVGRDAIATAVQAGFRVEGLRVREGITTVQMIRT